MQEKGFSIKAQMFHHVGAYGISGNRHAGRNGPGSLGGGRDSGAMMIVAA